MKSITSIIELFRAKGYKITPQRRVIFKLLTGDDSHPTAEEVYQRVLAVMPDISRTTVYNTLKELLDLGELTLLDGLSESGSRYDTQTECHHHLFCMCCNSLVDIWRDFKGLEIPPENVHGYRIMKRQVIFYGYCPECQKSKSYSDSGSDCGCHNPKMEGEQS